MFSLSPARRGRIVLIGIAIAMIAFFLSSARSALFPFVIGSFLVYLLLPMVNRLDKWMPKWLQERQMSRPISILLTYLLVVLLLIGFFALFVPVVTSQTADFIGASGQYTLQFLRITKGFNRALLDEWLERYYTLIPDWARDTIDSNIQQITAFLANALQNLISWLGKMLQRALLGTIGVVTSTVSFVLGIVIVPFWVFYVLNDERKITEAFYSIIPEQHRADVRNLQTIISEVLGAYLRGQLLLCLSIGLMATVGLLVLGVNFSMLLGTIAGILEIIPNIGPFLGAIPAVLVALLESPTLALGTAILFVIIQQVENIFLVPKVAGESVKLHPTVIMVVLIVGSQVAGVWGIVLAVPLTGIMRDVFRYLYLRLSDVQISPEEAILLVHPRKRILPAKGPSLSWREQIDLWEERLSSVLRDGARILQHSWQFLVYKARAVMIRYRKPAEKRLPDESLFGYRRQDKS